MFIIILSVLPGKLIYAQNELSDSLNALSDTSSAKYRVIYLNLRAEFLPDSLSLKKLHFAQAALDSARNNGITGWAAYSAFNAGSLFHLKNELYKARDLLLYAEKNWPPGFMDFYRPKVYDKLGYIYLGLGKSDSVLHYHSKQLKAAGKTGDSLIIATAYTELGLSSWRTGKLEKALSYFNKAKIIRKEHGDKESFASTLNSIGSVYWKLGNYSKAMENFAGSSRIRKEINELEGMSINLSNIGKIYQVLKYRDKAEGYFRRAYTIADSVGYIFGSAYARYNMGILQQEFGNYDSALVYLSAADTLAASIPDHNLMAMIDNYTGYNYECTGNTGMAEKFYKEALSTATEINDIYAEAMALQNLGRLELSFDRPMKAKDYIRKSIKISRNNHLLNLSKDNFYLLYKINQADGRRYASLVAYKYYAEIKDSLLDETIVNSIANSLIKLEIEEAEETNRILKQQKAMQEVNLKNQKARVNYFTIILLLCLGLLVALGVLYYYRHKTSAELLQQKKRLQELNTRLNKQNNELQEMIKTREKLFSVIAHDLKNQFGVIMNYSQMLYEDLETMSRKELSDFSGTIYHSSREVHKSFENILEWARNQVRSVAAKPIKFDLLEIAREVYSVYYRYAEIKKLGFDIDVPEGITVYADRDMIDSILKNLVSNALKYTEPGTGKIRLDAVRKGDFYEVSVTDNGIGMNNTESNALFDLKPTYSRPGTKNEKGTGLGLTLSTEFVEKNGGKLRVKSEPGKGSVFTFTIPAA